MVCSALRVSCIKSSTLNTSGLCWKKSSFNTSSGNMPLRVLRNIFLRWLNDCLTILLKSCSSQPRVCASFLVRRITADRTFGGGLKEPCLTVNRYFPV